MNKTSKYNIKKGEVLIGSGLLRSKSEDKTDRVSNMLDHMDENSAFLEAVNLSGSEDIEQILNQSIENFRSYRNNWNQQPKICIRERYLSQEMRLKNLTPLCIDIETAAICDLACPFCFRQFLATPDKLIDPEFCYSIIDQAAELGVPSIKFNWRGEPLLHPKLPDFIAYAKKKGILETIINTNATQLNAKRAKGLIEAGLDFMIYSFDGGTKETYEKMRPGRFKKNNFETVYENIKRFSDIRKQSKSTFPYTKIQMVMTKESFTEKDLFFNLFSNYVDDVSLSQYTERGGEISDIDEETRISYQQGLLEHGLPDGTPYMRDPQGNLFISKKRKPCEQPFQRLLVTYEGRVGMCCFDWGASHPIGYLRGEAYRNEAEYDEIVGRSKTGSKGYELLSNVEKSKAFNTPAKKVESLADIWYGTEIDLVREKHISNKVDEVGICSGCSFKDTYEWVPV
jgi:MoaA/NifB/PqqE/SkfB family radical SAM enzyme